MANMQDKIYEVQLSDVASDSSSSNDLTITTLSRSGSNFSETSNSDSNFVNNIINRSGSLTTFTHKFNKLSIMNEKGTWGKYIKSNENPSPMSADF